MEGDGGGASPSKVCPLDSQYAMANSLLIVWIAVSPRREVPKSLVGGGRPVLNPNIDGQLPKKTGHSTLRTVTFGVGFPTGTLVAIPEGVIVAAPSSGSLALEC